MYLIRRFISNEVGTATVSWVVLTAGIIAITLVVLGKVFVGVNSTTEQIHDDIVVATDVSETRLRTPTVEELTYTMIGNDAEKYDSNIMTYIAWLPDVFDCENPTQLFSYETGLPMTLCLVEGGTLTPSVSMVVPVKFRTESPRQERCETPAFQYDLTNTPAVSCLPVPTLSKDAMVVIPAPKIRVAGNEGMKQIAQRCDDPSYVYPDFTDTAQLICLTPANVISAGLDRQYTFTMVEEIFVPEDCGAFECQYNRVPEVEEPLEQFVAAPSLFTPAECENPPCRFAREVTFEPKFPNFMAPPSFAPAEPEVAVVAKSLHPGFRSSPSFVAPVDCNDPPCGAPVSSGPILPSLPTINVLGAPPT